MFNLNILNYLFTLIKIKLSDLKQTQCKNLFELKYFTVKNKDQLFLLIRVEKEFSFFHLKSLSLIITLCIKTN